MFTTYYSKQKGNRYYVGEATCCHCKNQIPDNLFLNFHWSKKHKPIFETYCLDCIKKMKDYGRQIREIIAYVIVDSIEKLPKDASPIFPRPPTLINSKGMNCFEAAFVNSEAEIIDHTRLAGRSDPNAERVALEIKKNKEMLAKRDKELGQSPFLLSDMQRDEEKAERDSKYGKGKYPKRFKEEMPEDNFDVDAFLDGVQNSKPAIDHDDKKLLE